MSKTDDGAPGSDGADDSFASLLRKKAPAAGGRSKRPSFAGLIKGEADPEDDRREAAAASGPGDEPTDPEIAGDEAEIPEHPAARPPVGPDNGSPSAMNRSRVAVFENGPSNQARAVDVIAALGYAALDTRRDLGRLRQSLEEPDPPEVAVVGLPGGEEAIELVRELRERRDPAAPTLIVATLPGPAESARRRAAEIGSDLFLVRPHARDNLAAVLAAADELGRTRVALAAARGSERELRDRLAHFGQPDDSTGFHQFEFFQRVLVMELKRAKRYGYSLAAALVAFDEQPTTSSPAAARGLRERIAMAITSNIRDIDLPVEHSDGRVLIFLPYTDLEGATEVGNRVVATVRAHGRRGGGGEGARCTVSIGIAAIRPGAPISFARLMKDANQALRAAQLKGGDRVIVRQGGP
jgi:diguanylate cyclase (GGDEF)-like protein